MMCKLSDKLDFKTQYEMPIPDNLIPAAEDDIELFKYSTGLFAKSIQEMVEEWSKELYVAYGTVVDARDRYGMRQLI